MRLLAAYMLVLALSAVGCSGVAATSGGVAWPARPESILIGLGDLPSGFTLDKRASLSAEESGSLPTDPSNLLSDPDRWGWLEGHYISFRRSGPEALTGTAIVGAEVHLFRTPEGASAYQVALKRQWGEDRTTSPVSVASVGDESYAVHGTTSLGSGSGKVEMDVFTLSFRVRNVAGSVFTSGKAGTTTIQDAQKYASLMAGRVK